MKLVYTEFLYPIRHYFGTLNWHEALFDIGLPIVIGVIGFLLDTYYQFSINTDNASGFFGNVIILLSILVGFTISSVTIIASTHDKINKPSSKYANGINLNLYQLMSVTFIYNIFAEIFTIVYNLAVILLLAYRVEIIINQINILILANIVLILHILLLNVRNITNFYFVFHRINTHK